MQNIQTEKNETLSLVIQIDGGIGRTICSVAALEFLAKQNPNRKLFILTSHADTFLGNPYIHRVYRLNNNDYLWDDVIKKGEFIYPEPYYNRLYYTQKHHLIQSFNYLLNGCEDFSLPQIYLTKDEIKWGENFIAARKKDSNKPVAILQPYGAAATFQENEFKDDTQRSLPPLQLDNLLQQLKNDCVFINACHISLNYPHVWQEQFTTRQLFSLIRACDFLLTVDSFASHAGAAFNKKGVLLLGGTYKENVGYSHYKVINRKGFPQGYMPNRFGSFIEKQNIGAMDFSEDEILVIVNEVRSLISELQKPQKSQTECCKANEKCTKKSKKK